MENERLHNFYIEPVEIEIYLKKQGTIKTIIKDLYIELIDVEPSTELSEKAFDFFKNQDQPIDLIELQNNFPETILTYIESYYQYSSLYERLSMHIRSYLSGSVDALRQSLYLTELLMKYEPTIASLEHLGDFSTYNLNYFIRKLNELEEEFLLEDNTVEYLINRRRKFYEGREDDTDKEFEKLVELWHYNIKEKPVM